MPELFLLPRTPFSMDMHPLVFHHPLQDFLISSIPFGTMLPILWWWYSQVAKNGLWSQAA